MYITRLSRDPPTAHTVPLQHQRRCTYRPTTVCTTHSALWRLMTPRTPSAAVVVQQWYDRRTAFRVIHSQSTDDNVFCCSSSQQPHHLCLNERRLRRSGGARTLRSYKCLPVLLYARSFSGKSIGYEISGLCYQQIFYEALQHKRYGHCKILPGSVWIWIT